MNWAEAMCLNEILIASSLEGVIQLYFYAAIHAKCFTKNNWTHD